MAKNSKKNENRRESLRKKEMEAPKKAKETLKKVKASPKKAKQTLTVEAQLEIMKARDAERNLLIEDMKRRREYFAKAEIAENERIVNTILDIGYVFRPEEGKLLDYYLRNKIMGEPVKFCPIKEVNVYEIHPQALTGITGQFKVSYFFTRSRPNEIQPGTSVQGHWILGEKSDVFYQDEKIGVKQVSEYCEAGHERKYKIIEYRLDPAPENMKNGLWFVCKLSDDADNEP